MDQHKDRVPCHFRESFSKLSADVSSESFGPSSCSTPGSSSGSLKARSLSVSADKTSLTGPTKFHGGSNSLREGRRGRQGGFSCISLVSLCCLTTTTYLYCF